MASRDEVVGRNMRSFREASALSQANLADAMSAAGFEGFYPQTITKLEKGTRSLKLVEALKLADILGVRARDFFDPPTTATFDLKAYRAVKDLRAAHQDLQRAYRNHIDANYNVERALEFDLSEDTRRHVKAWAPLLSAERAITAVFGQVDEEEAEMMYGEIVRTIQGRYGEEDDG